MLLTANFTNDSRILDKAAKLLQADYLIVAETACTNVCPKHQRAKQGEAITIVTALCTQTITHYKLKRLNDKNTHTHMQRGKDTLAVEGVHRRVERFFVQQIVGNNL